MDNLIDFYRRNRYSQWLAERDGFLDMAAAFKRTADAVLLEFGGDIAEILCLTSRPVLPSVGALRIERQAQQQGDISRRPEETATSAVPPFGV